MLNLAYSISTDLREALNKIESLRHQILLTPLPPKTELRWRWEATISRIYWAMTLSGNQTGRAEIVKLVTSFSAKKLTPSAQEVVNHKKAQDFISHNWLVNPKPVIFHAVEELATILWSQTEFKGLLRALRGEENAIRQLLDYLSQAQSENPVIAAAIVQSSVSHLDALVNDKGKLAGLMMLLFLYKPGYDCRGFLVMDEYWHHDPNALRHVLATTKQMGNVTVWLEYFARGLATQLTKVAEDIASMRFKLDVPATFWELNDRQKEILSLLEAPESSITNRKVQKLFHISQITASRDLSKLASLGLLLVHGKGRSVSYSRV